ncbi:MAG: transcription antitermination factor NusB [Propionibacteriaceae bacterium]|nr:transcription antitermination factor NusB [Propionibacteriaceae bacterium]
MPAPKTPARHKARKKAVDILYAADLLGNQIGDELARQREADTTGIPLRGYTYELVVGVAAKQPEIDAALSEHLSEQWPLSRMTFLDRAIARAAVYELLFTEVEPAVAISEAVSLADELSGGSSAKFLNGVLAAIARTGQPA